MGYGEYTREVSQGSATPAHQFEFGKYLLDPESELASQFNKLIDGQIKLANISTKEQMALEQMQIYNIMDLFSMSLKEPAILPLFKFCYYAWKGGLTLSRAKKGRERGLLAMLGTTQAPAESEGFAQAMGLTEDKEESQFFSKLAGLRPKPKNKEDW